MKVEFKLKAHDLIKTEIKKRLFKFIIGDKNLLFVKPDDIISQDFISNGYHEYGLTQFIKFFADKDFNDFFIDIGSNIGLISSPVSCLFKELHLFEPNPVAAHILSANMMISGSYEKSNIYEFGLGKSKGIIELKIPPKNYGGAFINSNDNMYTSEELFLKDGYENTSFDGHLIQKVQIVDANQFFPSFLKDIENRELKKGIIKIDVEGMELVILEAIANSLPSNFEIIIIYEDWFRKTGHELISKIFGKNACLFFLKRNRRYKIGSLWSKIISVILEKIDGKSVLEYELLPWKEMDVVEDKSLDMVIFLKT